MAGSATPAPPTPRRRLPHVQHAVAAEKVRAGDEQLLESCANEAIRLRQRSLVLRSVLRETELADEQIAYRVSPGMFSSPRCCP